MSVVLVPIVERGIPYPRQSPQMVARLVGPRADGDGWMTGQEEEKWEKDTTLSAIGGKVFSQTKLACSALLVVAIDLP